MVLLGWISFWMGGNKIFLSWFVPLCLTILCFGPSISLLSGEPSDVCRHSVNVSQSLEDPKHIFQGSHWSPRWVGDAKEPDSPFTPTPTHKVAAALLRGPPASPCSISALQLVYVLVLILYLVNLLLLLTLIVLVPCWCIGCPRNFIIFANNDNVMSPRSILLHSPPSFLTHWPGPSLLCKLSAFLTFSQP